MRDQNTKAIRDKLVVSIQDIALLKKLELDKCYSYYFRDSYYFCSLPQTKPNIIF